MIWLQSLFERAPIPTVLQNLKNSIPINQKWQIGTSPQEND